MRARREDCIPATPTYCTDALEVAATIGSSIVNVRSPASGTIADRVHNTLLDVVDLVPSVEVAALPFVIFEKYLLGYVVVAPALYWKTRLPSQS